jgi:hypothetical protein
MSIEINEATDTLQIKHPSTGKWTAGITLLQILGGFDTKLVESQIQEIETINSNILKLQTSLGTTNEEITSQAEAVIDKLQELKLALPFVGGGNSSDFSGMENQLQSLNTVATEIRGSCSQIYTRLALLNDVVTAIGGVNTTLKVRLTKDIKEDVVNLTDTSVKTFSIPDNTETLVFVCRKDSYGASQDIKYSFKPGSIESGSYRTLFQLNEYNKSNLNLQNKTLFLQAISPIVVEVTAYYTPSV